MEGLNCLRCAYRHEDNGNCTATGGFCTAVPAAHCRLLQKYLDTGLTPEKVLPKDKADEIALKCMRLADLESLCSYTRLRELAEADKDGRLVVLPWIPGLVLTPKNALYIIDEDEGKIYEDGLYEAEIGMNSEGRIAVNFVTLDSCLFYDEDIGKTIFLTREEAEKALEGRR